MTPAAGTRPRPARRGRPPEPRHRTSHGDRTRPAREPAEGRGALDRPWDARPAHGHVPFTRRAKKVLELSLREALALKHDHIGAGHLLLAILQDGAGRAAGILTAGRRPGRAARAAAGPDAGPGPRGLPTAHP